MRDRDPMVALLLELIGGFFGFLGIGWIYAGKPAGGIILLIGYWLLDWIVGLTLAVATLGAHGAASGRPKICSSARYQDTWPIAGLSSIPSLDCSNPR